MKIILIILLSVSCSFKSLIVSKLDYLMTSKISDELSLNDEQESELRADIKSFLNQNKDSAKELKSQIDSVEIGKKIPVETIKRQYYIITNRLIPIISKYYFKLSAKQKKDFFEFQEDKNRDVEKRMEKMTVKTVSKKYDAFFGYINDKQIELISNNFSVLKKLSKIRIERRIQIQTALKESKTFEQVENSFGLFTKSLSKNNELNQQFFNFLTNMIELTNKDQRETLNEKKLELVQILEYYITNTY